VVRAAAELVDEQGYDQLTLAALAQRVGVAAPSLYKHVDGIDDLNRGLAALALRELGEAMGAAAVGRARGDALRGIANAYRAYAIAHPGRYPATLRAPDPGDVDYVAAAQTVLDVVFAVLAGYGLTGDDAIDATRAVHAAVHGFASLEAAGSFGMPQSIDRSYDRLIDGLDAALTGLGATAASP
jgi:AcrR family transcriptional regulator